MASPFPILHPFPRPLGAFRAFTPQHSETLILHENVISFSGGSFDVRLPSGQPVLRIKGRTMTVSGRKEFYDVHNNHLFDIVKKNWHMHSTFAVEMNGEKIMEVKDSMSSVFGQRSTATFSHQGQEATLIMKGSFFDQSAEIVDEGGAVAAVLLRKFDGRSLARDVVLDAQTYAVTVAPGVDFTLILAMCVIMDEFEEEKRSS